MRALLLLALAACGGGEVADGDEVEASIEAPELEELSDRWEASYNDGDGASFEVNRVGDDFAFGFGWQPDSDLPITGLATIESRGVDNFGTVDALVFTTTDGEEVVVSAFVFFDNERLELGAFPADGGYLRFRRVSAP